MLERLFVLLLSAWIITAAPAPSDGVHQVPEIEDCAYVDAYYVTCWWKRPNGDDTTVYRLGYISAADAIHERRERYCEVTQQSTDGDVITESCGIHGSMYQMFTLWVASVQNCDVTTASCVASSKSKELDFTCTRQNVRLTIPPGSLNINDEERRLTWEAPERDHSMLSFVLSRRRVMYRVEYREFYDGKESDWEVWYKGYETGVFLLALTPGATYEFRVSASLDAPSSFRLSSSESSDTTDRDWTEASNVLVFIVPKSMRATSGVTAIRVEGDVEVAIPDQTTSSVIIDDITRPVQVSQRVITASVVTSFIIFLVLAVLGYFLPWNRWCLADKKFAKPNLFLDFKTFQDEESMDPKGDDNNLNVEDVKEQVHPISQVFGYKSEISVTNNPGRNNLVLGFIRNDTNESDFGRQRPLSPSRNLEETLSLNELLDRVHTIDSDVTYTDDVMLDNGQIQHKRGRMILKTNERLSENESIRYVKFGHGSQDSDIPSYLMTSSDGSDRMTVGSLDRSMSEYVIDDTGIESAFTNDLSDITDMTSSDEYTHEKEHQLRKYAKSTKKSQISDEESDGVPDYVMHNTSFTKDFSQDMTMFISMVTEDVTQRSPVNIYDDTEELLQHYKDKRDYLRMSADKESAGENSRFGEGKSSDVVILTMCPSCKTTQKHERCSNGQNKNKNEMTLPLPITLDRRGSLSEHSIDSGYSPDSPDCVILSSTDKDTLLTPRFKIGGSVADSDSDSENDEYMTYVTT